ncbi:MAG: LysR substrate-binding domain-containing protein [Rhizobiaceae bacterium]
MRDSKTLYSLHALRAFEAVGRLLNFREAGEELLITQSAVSHHIRRLEEDLGALLFVRNGRSISFTPVGEKYHKVVRKAFSLLVDGAARIEESLAKPRVCISLLPSFTTNWLVPRLEQFKNDLPHIDLDIESTFRFVDLVNDSADIIIRYGEDQWRNGSSQLLIQEQLTPVMSPQLHARLPIHKASDVMKHTLLRSLHPFDWEVWANAAEIDIVHSSSIQLTDFNIAIQAAIAGQGIALGRTQIIKDHLQSGTLISPCKLIVTSPSACYWLISRKPEEMTDASKEVSRWLLAQTSYCRPKLKDNQDESNI